jgi:16S rRNA (cytosine967-C5)-methyltransferase
VSAAAEAPGAAVRAAAARAIRAVRFDGQSLRPALATAIAPLADARDRALCEAICFEACRWALRYESWLAAMMPRPLPPSLRDVHALLLAGLAQLDAMALAPYAAISASAGAARDLRHPRHVGLVNALLRRFVRERDALLRTAEQDATVRHAHPDWLVQALRRDWGDAAESILQQNNIPGPLWLRANARRIDAATLRARLAQAGIEAEPVAFAPEALRLAAGPAPTRLPGWDEGEFAVQDLAPQLSAPALGARPGERVLDACAAPGGKAAHLLERVPGVDLLALDLDPVRLERVQAALQRLGLAAQLRVADAAQPESWWDGRPFDRILLDAPCSGTGVIRRQPDIKLHRRGADIAASCAQQARLLDALWPMLRPGGRLVYATCSVLKDENERQIDAFLARTDDAVALPLAPHYGRVSGAGAQRLPGEDGGDGFFHAALEKRA